MASLPVWLPAAEATTVRVAVVQCPETYDEDWQDSQMSSQALVGLAVLLGIRYETVVLDELLDESPDAFSGLWFSSCAWVNEGHYASLVAYIDAHMDAGGSVFLDGPLGLLYRAGGDDQYRGMDELVPILGIDVDGFHSTGGYDLVTTGSTHPVAVRAGYEIGEALAVDLKGGTDTLFPIAPNGETLLEVRSPFDGASYPFLVVAEPIPGSKVVAIGVYGNYLGIASPFRNSPSTQFYDNQVLPYLLESLAWASAPDGAPSVGLQLAHAPVTAIARLDGDWSDVDDATRNTLSYLVDLGEDTGIATVYGIVSGFAEAAGVWPEFADQAPALQALGGTIGSHSRNHENDMSDVLDAAGWEDEVAGSLQDIRDALTNGEFAPDAYALINPGNTIRSEDYGEFFDDVQLYLSHGFETVTPFSSGVLGFGLPSGVPPVAVINDMVAPDYQWLYSSSWIYTVEEAAAYQAAVLDYYQHTVGRGVLYNVMWHDYCLGGGSPPEHYPDTPSTLPLFETARTHFWNSEVYAPTVAEVVGKLHLAKATAIATSMADSVEIDLDYAAVPAAHRAHVAGMGLRIHQPAEPVRRVVIDGTEHFAFSDDTIMMPAAAGATQHVTVELGAGAGPAFRLTFASKAVTSAAQAGPGVAAVLARPGSAMRFCFAGPRYSVVLGANVFYRNPAGDACGSLEHGNPRPQIEIQPLDTGALDVSVRLATRPLADAYRIDSVIRIDVLPGDAAVLDFESAQLPAQVLVDGVAVSPVPVAGGFTVDLPPMSGPGAVEIAFVDEACEPTETPEASCADGLDNDCDALADCADADCAGVGACPETPRTVIVSDVEDATVRETEPTANFGAGASLEVDTASVFQYALIKPGDLGDIAPGAHVVSARLVLQIFNPGDTVEVHEVLGAWSELAVTWNTAPAPAPGTLTAFAGSPTGEIAIDITAIAQAWVDGAPIHGVRLFPTGADGVDLHSSESATASLRPYFAFEVLDSGITCDDGDGDGAAAAVCGGTDCDDADPGVHPAAAEVCDDAIDNDCDGATDCGDDDCAGVGGCPALPRIVVVGEVEDATVRQTEPTANFGAGGSLEVDTASVFQYALVKPGNLADIEAGAHVVSARLVLQIFNPGDPFQVHEVLDDWSELAVTWNTAPSTAAAVYGTFAGSPTGEIAIDITPIAQGWVDGNPRHGVQLFPTGADGVDLYSSESPTASLRPYFELEVRDGGGTCDDGDGDGAAAAACGGTDCDDADPGVHPGAAEVCDGAVDDDCDGLIDCSDGDCTGVGTCPALPRAVVVEAIADATVRQSEPTTNFGAGASLEVDTASVFQYALVKPGDLADIEPGAHVVSARLVLQIFNAGDPVELHEVLDDWSELAVTWDTAPSTAAAVYGSFAGSPTREVSVDITPIAQRWVNGDPAYGIQLLPTGGDGVDIHSSDSSVTSLRPYIAFEVIDGGGIVPTTVVLANLEDTYVADDSPDTSFGAAASLEVDTWATFERTFIKPSDLGGLAPGAVIASARLVLHIENPGDSIVAREVLSSWSAGALTWNTAPAAAPAFAALPAGVVGEVAIDVTALVQSWVDGAPVYGVNLDPTSSDGVTIHSTEATDPAVRPHIVVETVE